MPPAVQTLRSLTPGMRPTGRAEGELFVNFPDKQLSVVDDTLANVDLMAIRFFSEAASYAEGDLVVRR